CALEAPSGAVRLKSTSLPASAAGYGQLLDWLRAWGAASTLLIGLESTGSRWEPLYDTLVQAGYSVTQREPPPDRLVGRQPAAAPQDGWDRCAHPGARPQAGGLGTGEYSPRRDGAGPAHAEAYPTRLGGEPKRRSPALVRRIGPRLPRAGGPLARPRRTT